MAPPFLNGEKIEILFYILSISIYYFISSLNLLFKILSKMALFNSPYHRQNKTSTNFNVQEYVDGLDIYIPNLDLSNCQLTTIPDLSKFVNLKSFKCSKNNLISLPTLPKCLRELYCYENQLTQLPELPPNLKVLACGDNNIIQLPKLPVNLDMLICSNNKLKQLPDLPKKLNKLYCSNNLITQLPIMSNYLAILSCYENRLTTLPKLSKKLVVLNCYNNQITRLPTLPDTLLQVSCGNNCISYIPPLSEKQHIERFDLINNPIYDIVSQNSNKTIQEVLKIIYNAKKTYYTLKYGNKIRNFLYIKVLEPNAQQKYHPNNLIKLLNEHSEEIVDELLSTW